MRIHTIDLCFQGQPGVIAAYLIESEGSWALIETGPGSSLPKLVEQVIARGVQPKDVKHVLVTHIHLDHAGAAGWWAQLGATVYCHPSAVRHIVDPSKLMESARRIYSDRMDSLWGEMLPAPQERVIGLQDGAKVKVGGVEIMALDTPGHARHHLAFVLGDVCFTGDVAGMRLQGCAYTSVTAAPPQFDPVAYAESLERLHGMHFSKLYLTHFGPVTDVSAHLSNYALHVEQAHETVEGLMDQGLEGDALQAAYERVESAVARKAGVTDAEWARYQLANSTQMCADGIALFIRKEREK